MWQAGSEDLLPSKQVEPRVSRELDGEIAEPECGQARARDYERRLSGDEVSQTGPDWESSRIGCDRALSTGG